MASTGGVGRAAGRGGRGDPGPSYAPRGRLDAAGRLDSLAYHVGQPASSRAVPALGRRFPASLEAAPRPRRHTTDAKNGVRSHDADVRLMRRFAPGWGEPSGSRRRPPNRALLLVALVPLMAGLIAAPAAPVARGDELSTALDAQQSLQQQVADQKAQIDKLNALQAGLRTDIANTAKALKQVNADLAAVRARIDDMAAQIAQVQAIYDQLVAELGALARQVLVISTQEQQKADQLAQRKALLADRIRQAYATDRTSMLETFLSGGSFADILTEVGYFLDVGEQDKALAQQIAADQLSLAAIHRSLVYAQGQTDQLRTQTAAQKAQLDAQLADLQVARDQLKQLEAQTARTLATQKAAYQKLALNKAAAQKALDEAAAAQKQLQAKIDQLIAARQQFGNIPSQYNGTLAWPADGIVSQEFGCTGVIWEPPLGSCAHFHQGIDIAADMYTPVRAAADGTVVFAGFNPWDAPPQAYIVVIAHSQSLNTWYAHLDASTHPVTVQAGDVVHQGDVIGYIGMTGHTTGPHLHWAVEFQGAMVNPRLFL